LRWRRERNCWRAASVSIESFTSGPGVGFIAAIAAGAIATVVGDPILGHSIGVTVTVF
jgi:hypothetical protein